MCQPIGREGCILLLSKEFGKIQRFYFVQRLKTYYFRVKILLCSWRSISWSKPIKIYKKRRVVI
jgi:hypothetical protein